MHGYSTSISAAKEKEATRNGMRLAPLRNDVQNAHYDLRF
jgi:hypothetical protein